jgi:hypothetical protein
MPGAEVFDLQSTLRSGAVQITSAAYTREEAFAFVNEVSRTLLPLLGRRLSSPQVFFHILPAPRRAHSAAEINILASVIQIAPIKTMDFTNSLLENIRAAGGAGCLIRSICDDVQRH